MNGILLLTSLLQVLMLRLTNALGSSLYLMHRQKTDISFFIKKNSLLDLQTP